MPRIKIDDLKLDLEEIKKKDPKILNKIRGGYRRWKPGPIVIGKPSDSGWGTLCDTSDFGCP